MRHQWVWPAIALLAIAIAMSSLVMRASREQTLAATKPKELELIHKMRLALLAASETQYSSLIATDPRRIEELTAKSDSSFAELSLSLDQLEKLLPAQNETQHLEGIKSSIGTLEKLRGNLNSLRAQNTNRKAFHLAANDGLQLLRDIDKQMRSWTEIDSTDSSVSSGQRLQLCELRLSLQRIQSLLLPHIAEASDATMDQLEAEMALEQNLVDECLMQLKSSGMIPNQISWLTSQVNRYRQLKTQIIELSRANSNIRSESLALNEYRDAHLACEAALVEMQKQVEAIIPESVIPKGRL